MTHSRKLTKKEVLAVLTANQNYRNDFENISEKDLNKITKMANKEVEVPKRKRYLSEAFESLW